MLVDDTVNVFDLARLTRRRLPRVVRDYLDGGAEDELSVRANRSAFAGYCFRPSLLREHARLDLSVSLFRRRLETPVLIGPTGLARLFWSNADLALARVASNVGVGFVLSAGANNSVEQVVAACVDPKWFQFYPKGTHDLWAPLMERAAAAGYPVPVVMVDSLVAGNRQRDARNRFSQELRVTPKIVPDVPPAPACLGMVAPRHAAPGELGRVPAARCRRAGPGRVCPRPPQSGTAVGGHRVDETAMARPACGEGGLTGVDTRRSADAGAGGMIVSNHGGRQLNGATVPLDALPEVAAARPPMTVLFDGGTPWTFGSSSSCRPAPRERLSPRSTPTSCRCYGSPMSRKSSQPKASRPRPARPRSSAS